MHVFAVPNTGSCRSTVVFQHVQYTSSTQGWGTLLYYYITRKLLICVAPGEACFLLWGAYLSWVVRKAPTHFNESKYITWAIYNNIILGSFVLVIRWVLVTRQMT